MSLEVPKFPEEDTIFVVEARTGKAEVVMDSASLELLISRADREFKIMGNPRAKSSYGCGTLMS
jgi:Fe-S cluster assembly iron-binding protein IscA